MIYSRLTVSTRALFHRDYVNLGIEEHGSGSVESVAARDICQNRYPQEQQSQHKDYRENKRTVLGPETAFHHVTPIRYPTWFVQNIS